MTTPWATPELSCAEQVDHLLNRIGELDPGLGSILVTAPEAMTTAIALDVERRDHGPRGPLHGVPVLVKDNIDTYDMETTCGSLALTGHRPAEDALLVRRLRDAGMVVLGKTNLSEWANIRSPHSTSGWSAVGGLTANPWGIGRNAGGSSSGSGAAVAAGLAPMAIGTETDGSIVCPASLNGVVGIKPTVGLLPTSGVVPISSSQDAPGPMARSVLGAAALLDVLALSPNGRYTEAASTGSADEALRGLRIGVARTYFGAHPATDAVAEHTLQLMASAGAVVVDPANIPPLPSYDSSKDELSVLLHELVGGLADYLASRPADAPKTLHDIVAFNRVNASVEMAWFGQEFFEQALTEPMRDVDAYDRARYRARAAGGHDGIDKTLAEHQLDALVAPTFGPAWLSDLVNGDQVPGGACTAAPAIAGYPIVSVPMGFVHGLPVGLAVFSTGRTEETLIRIARGVELAVGLLQAGALVPPGWLA